MFFLLNDGRLSSKYYKFLYDGVKGEFDLTKVFFSKNQYKFKQLISGTSLKKGSARPISLQKKSLMRSFVLYLCYKDIYLYILSKSNLL